jgi:hypothetical protein
MKGITMKEYTVMWSNRNEEFTVIVRDDTDPVWREHSGPYYIPAIAEEIAEALTIKARLDEEKAFLCQ